jgi:hypothetical protein
MANTISLTKNTDGSVSFICSGEEEIVIASPIQLFVDNNSISFRVESEVRVMKLSDSITIGGVLFSGTLAQLKTAVENILPGSAPATALPTETVATYSAMQTSITADPSTKRDFFVSADSSSFRYNGSYLVPLGNSKTAPAMVTVACGNSITAQSKYTGSYFQTKAEIHWANVLSGSPMNFKLMTASTRADKFGVYGYSGATLATILTDLDTNWFAPLKTANIIPDLVIGHALTENDIGTRTVAQITASILSWLRNVQNRWPGARVLLVTPRPSFGFNTTQVVQTYQGVRDYMLSLDNGRDIFVARGDVYESATDPAKPDYITFTGSISGTTLTVTSVTGTIMQGSQITDSLGNDYGRVSYFGTGTGGAGTYILTNSNTVASKTLYHAPYTDVSVHPNARGSLLLARQQAFVLNRIANVWKQSYGAISNNIALDGTAAATGTNVSGTAPTGVSITGSATCVLGVTAEQPGFKLNITCSPVSASNVPLGNGAITMGSIATTATQVSLFMVVEIVSGAENLRAFEPQPRIADGSGNSFQYYIQDQVGDTEPDFRNGDILTYRTPPFIAVSGSISAVQTYLGGRIKLAGGTAVVRILSQGVGIVS